MKKYACILVATLLFFSNINVRGQTILFEDFEAGIGQWSIDNDIWEIGHATQGPPSAHSGRNVAGTSLDSRAPATSGARLISPLVELPQAGLDERLQLKFWRWSYSNSVEQMVIQIYVDGDVCGQWQIITKPQADPTRVWTQHIVDLTDYEELAVRIAFLFESYSSVRTGSGFGWYLDDVTVEKTSSIMPNPEDFEAGIGDWYADNGAWQVRHATTGPPSAHSGRNVAGTTGIISAGANSRFISPPITLPTVHSGEALLLKFWHWSYSDPRDRGFVQVSIDGGLNWLTLSDQLLGNKREWLQHTENLNMYAGRNVRFAFYFVGSRGFGWFIDDVEIVVDVSTSVDQQPEALPETFVLHQNYPNPFNPETRIEYKLPTRSVVKLEIFNLRGQLVTTIVDQEQEAGSYSVFWDATDSFGAKVPSGIYFYRIAAGNTVQTRKMVLTR